MKEIQNILTPSKHHFKVKNRMLTKIGLSNKNKQVRILIGLVNTDENNVISPWNFLESFTLTSFEMQLCDWAVELFTAHIWSFLVRNKERLCFNLAKHWSMKQIANTFSRSYESRSIQGVR